MARVTVEDCVDKVDNRFELVMLASQRAKKLGAGAQMTIPRDNDKNPVVALREISEETILPVDLREELIRSYQRVVSLEDEDSEDMIDTMEGEGASGDAISAADTADGPAQDADKTGSGEPSLEDIAGGSGE